MFPLMAEITPKMRRLLRSGDRRKRKRGIRLYWAAPGEHSRGRILMEIVQGNFARSKFLIRGGPVSTTEWRKPFSRSEEHTSELQSLMRISSAVFCLTKKLNPLLHSIIHI